MSTARDALVKKAQGLKGKGRKARSEGKRAEAKSFKKGARRLARKLRSMPKPPAAKDGASAEASAG